MTTTDLAKFGYRELELAKELIQQIINNGLPVDFYDDEVTIMFNIKSGYVFITNSDFQVAMLNDGKLEMFYSCGGCGAEGFANEIDWNQEWQCCGDCL